MYGRSDIRGSLEARGDPEPARRTAAPGRLATSTITPYTTAVATPSDAPSPAAANAQAVTPSRGPQPPMLGSAAACITSSASGSSSDGGAVTPALRAAIRNVAVWPATTSADASAMAGHARRASSASRRSRATARRSRAHRDGPAAGRTCAASATPAAAAMSASATSGMAACTGDGRTRSTATVRTTCTTCPAERSHATARSPRPTSLVSRPWLIPRWTSPTTPPGSVTLRKSER